MDAFTRRPSTHVLRHTIPERPILRLHFHQIDEHVLAADAHRLVQAIGNAEVERFLLRLRAPFAPGDLHADEVIGAGHAEVARVEDEGTRLVFLEDLEAIVFRNTRRAQGLIDGLPTRCR